MTLRRPLFILHISAAACAAFASVAVHASGGGVYDPFVNRSAPDIALNHYQTGELGIVLPSYDRTYLYAAWRAVALGPQELKKAANPQGGLLRANGSRVGGWLDAKEGAKVYAAWQAAVDAALKRVPTPPVKDDMLAAGYLNCPLGSYSFATATLSDLARRADATPARLQGWISTQKQVFKFCGDNPGGPRREYGQPKPVIPALAALPAGEALYWRQMQQYQLASAAFYDENYALSGKLYADIAATDQHPLRPWGAYLSLRSQARAATFVPENDAAAGGATKAAVGGATKAAAAGALQSPQQKLAAIQASAEQILRDPALASLQEATRAIVRSAQASLTPEARYLELGRLLDDPRANPYLDDHLGDWRVLASQLLTTWEAPGSNSKAELARAALKKTGFVHWIETMRECRATDAFADSDARKNAMSTGSAGACKAAHAEALAQWRRHAAANNMPQARVWLLASAMTGGALPADAEKAALQTSAGAPEYLSLRYALARHYRLSQQPVKARAVTEAVLADATPANVAATSASVRNQFLQERFALASTPADAAPYLLRTLSRDLDPDTGEVASKTGADGAGGVNAADSATPAVVRQSAGDGLR